MPTEIKELPGGGVRLTDFRLAGFLSARQIKLVGTEVNARGEVVFSFGAGAQEMLTQFPGSPEQQYDAAVRAMHDLVRATLGRSRR